MTLKWIQESNLDSKSVDLLNEILERV